MRGACVGRSCCIEIFIFLYDENKNVHDRRIAPWRIVPRRIAPPPPELPPVPPQK